MTDREPLELAAIRASCEHDYQFEFQNYKTAYYKCSKCGGYSHDPQRRFEGAEPKAKLPLDAVVGPRCPERTET